MIRRDKGFITEIIAMVVVAFIVAFFAVAGLTKAREKIKQQEKETERINVEKAKRVSLANEKKHIKVGNKNKVDNYNNKLMEDSLLELSKARRQKNSTAGDGNATFGILTVC